MRRPAAITTKDKIKASTTTTTRLPCLSLRPPRSPHAAPHHTAPHATPPHRLPTPHPPQGDRLAALARDPATAWLPSYRAGALFRAMNFYVMSFWPYPAALGVEEQLGKGQEAFEEYLGLAGLDSTAFEVRSVG